MTTLAELLRRVEAADVRDRTLDLALLRAVSGKPWRWHNSTDETVTWDEYGPDAIGNPICSLDEFTESVDVSLYFCEGALPGYTIRMGTDEGPCWACINGLEEQSGEAPTLSRAILAALLKALIAQRGEG